MLEILLASSSHCPPRITTLHTLGCLASLVSVMPVVRSFYLQDGPLVRIPRFIQSTVDGVVKFFILLFMVRYYLFYALGSFQFGDVTENATWNVLVHVCLLVNIRAHFCWVCNWERTCLHSV